MEIINAIVQFVMDLGGGVFLPFTIVIMGLLFKMTVFSSCATACGSAPASWASTWC